MICQLKKSKSSKMIEGKSKGIFHWRKMLEVERERGWKRLIIRRILIWEKLGAGWIVDISSPIRDLRLQSTTSRHLTKRLLRVLMSRVSSNYNRQGSTRKEGRKSIGRERCLISVIQNECSEQKFSCMWLCVLVY